MNLCDSREMNFHVDLLQFAWQCSYIATVKVFSRESRVNFDSLRKTVFILKLSMIAITVAETALLQDGYNFFTNYTFSTKTSHLNV
jgi:hypothetical protein